MTWRGILIDGHNRFAICSKHGLEFQVVEREFEDRQAAELWMINNQLGRRNLESIDKVPLLERKREILAGMAKERQKGGQGGVLLVENLPQATDKTRDSIAAEIGVSGKTYDALRKVSNDGTDELKQAVREKKVGASTAAEIAQLPVETQREIAKTADTSTGSTGRAQHAVRWQGRHHDSARHWKTIADNGITSATSRKSLNSNTPYGNPTLLVDA